MLQITLQTPGRNCSPRWRLTPTIDLNPHSTEDCWLICDLTWTSIASIFLVLVYKQYLLERNTNSVSERLLKWYQNWPDRSFLTLFWVLEIRQSLLQHTGHSEDPFSSQVPQASAKESFYHKHWLRIHHLSLIIWSICITLFYMVVLLMEVLMEFFGVYL